jgi:hypothetical protein
MEQTITGGAATEQPTAQPTAVQTIEEVAADAPAWEQIDVAVSTREGSSRAEEEVRAPSPVRVGEPSAEVGAPDGAPDLGKGPMTSSTMVGRSAQGEEAQANSEDEVEEIQGHPRDGCQHIYVWRQRGDHWAGHEEIAEVEEAERVERATKCLVSKVKVSDPLTCKYEVLS